MREGDDCNFCNALLDAHCAVNGGDFCRLKEEYVATDLPADKMLDRFYEIVTDDQLVKTDPEVRRRMSFRNSQPDPGQAAAAKWLHNYRHGKQP